MQFFHIIALLAATAYALPQSLPVLGDSPSILGDTPSTDSPSTEAPSTSEVTPHKTSHKTSSDKGNQANVCGNGNKLSCCDSSSDGSFLNVLGALCSIQVPIVGVPLQSTCGAQQPMCCSTDQNGFLNVGEPCVPVSL